MAAFFGSQGLYVYDLAGTLQWKRDLGRLDVGAYDDPSYEWGNASSPILYQDLVIVQCDQQKDSFLIALRLSDGEIAWKASRDEQPSWATPTVFPGSGKGAAELVTNAPKFIRGYDPKTGRELWRLGRSSNITAPTPIFDGDLIVVMSGRRPNAPIFVLKAGAQGDITLPEGATSGGSVLWTKEKAGSYMPTPIAYGGHLYVLKNQGILSCYDLRTGELRYEQRLPDVTSGFSASPVAADGKLYLPSEDGEILVVKAGPQLRAHRPQPDGPAADGDAGDLGPDAAGARRARARGDRRALERAGGPASARASIQRMAEVKPALDLPTEPLSSLPDDPALWAEIPLELLVRFGCVPVRREGGRLVLAFGALDDVPRVDELEFQLGRPIEPVVAPRGARRASCCAATAAASSLLEQASEWLRAAARRATTRRRSTSSLNAPARPTARSCASWTR